MIELFPHNERAYEKLVQSLKTNLFGFIEHATGTGKSFIMLKYLYNIMREKRILIVSLHYEMFEQLLGSQMKTLGINREDFKKLDTMIYHNIINADPKQLIEDYDCFVFDEAHHCGALKWGEKVLELKSLIETRNDKRMIGFTATGTRYLDDYLDVANVYFNGNVVSRLPVSEAILENLLPAALYINSSRKCVEKINNLLEVIRRCPRNEEIVKYSESLNELKKKIEPDSDIPSLMKKYGVKKGEKYIVFCSSIADLELKMKEAKEWFPYEVKMYQAHSRQGREKNKEEINNFSNNKKDTCLMFAVDIFNEGFHIDDVDGIFMFRKTTSPIVYLQQIGRVLSFSTRKKQIKIFDMVDNISENDIVNELYREIISESKRLSKEHPEKKEFYQEILNRFNIIDNTSKIMDELLKIEDNIKSKYLIGNRIDKAINKLIEYRYLYPNGDIHIDFYRDKDKRVYYEAYQIINKNRDYLTDECIIKLKDLNIPFYNICLDLDKRHEELGDYKNYKELKNNKDKIFIQNYSKFVNQNGFRPRKDSLDINEVNLYNEYRSFLNNEKRNNLLKLINSINLSATVEELVLVRSIPTSDRIKEYLDYIRFNIINNIPLDEVERKVFNRIKKAIFIKDDILLKYSEEQDDFSKKIDQRISILEEYKRSHPQENFDKNHFVVINNNIYKAIMFIHKHALKINNYQFKRLLDLKMMLPDCINMTWDERMKELGTFETFYEKKHVNNYLFINRYISFIKVNGRRPNKEGEEKELALEYEKNISNINIKKLKECVNVMKVFGISITDEEKMLTNIDVTIDLVNDLYKRIKEKISKYDYINDLDMKILNKISGYANFLYLDEIKVIIQSQEYARLFYSSLYKIGTNLENSFMEKLYSMQTHLSKKMINELLRKNIELPKKLIEEVNKLEGYRTIYEKEKLEGISLRYQYIEYIKKYHKRPNDKKIVANYRSYLASLNFQQLKELLGTIKELLGSLLIEEEVLLGNLPDNINLLVLELKQKEKFDSLDYKLYHILLSNKLIDNMFINNRRPIAITKNNVEKNMYDEVIKKIEQNPIIEINEYVEFNYLSQTLINTLNRYRLDCLANYYLNNIYKKLKDSTDKSDQVLTKTELEVLRILSISNIEEDWVKEILIKIADLDYRNSFSQKNINYVNFMENYINFIISHKGLRPNILSEDIDEQNLALEFDNVKDILRKADIRRIEEVLSLSIKKEEEESFFNIFVKFIDENKRFPCNNAIDEKELKLATIYMNVSSKLSKEEQKYISILRGKYARNTMMASKKFTEMRKEKKYGKGKN